jgi:hypothetical protein
MASSVQGLITSFIEGQNQSPPVSWFQRKLPKTKRSSQFFIQTQIPNFMNKNQLVGGLTS